MEEHEVNRTTAVAMAREVSEKASEAAKAAIEAVKSIEAAAQSSIALCKQRDKAVTTSEQHLKRNGELQAEIEKLKSSVQDLERAHEQQLQELNEAHALVKQLTEQDEAQRAEIGKLKWQDEAQRKEMEELKGRFDKLSASLRELSDSHDRRLRRLGETEQELRDVRSELEAKKRSDSLQGARIMLRVTKWGAILIAATIVHGIVRAIWW